MIMSGRIRIIMTSIVLSIFLGTNTSMAQILQDSGSLKLIKKDIDCIYNLEFENAREITKKITKSYPDHPVVFLLKGLLTYWGNYPMLYTNPARISLEEDLRQCIRLSERNRNTSYKAEYLLSNLCARGLLIKFYDDNNLVMKVIPLAVKTYKHIRQSFTFAGDCTDLYYYTGVYNFYRESYPKVYPVYKPLVSLFPPGDMKSGLKQLNTSAVDAVVLRGESYFLLTMIYLNFEYKYQLALHYSRPLHEMYPDNVLYFAQYIKNLLLLKKYDEAEKLVIASLKGTGNKYYQAQLNIFKGILQEKKYHDNALAQQYYSSGISRIAPYGEYGNEYAAYAYFGLSRISYTKSDNTSGKKYREKAMKLGSYKKMTFDE